jgi:2-polyprenyl-3-methyl-5-hydroxy-6-metoxy-1,4-benzoquinol methylase
MTDKQPEALRMADELDKTRDIQARAWDAAKELRRLHEVNAELLEALKRILIERGFACECGIEDATWKLIEDAIAKATGEQQ